jgi:hypothetical protein
MLFIRQNLQNAKLGLLTAIVPVNTSQELAIQALAEGRSCVAKALLSKSIHGCHPHGGLPPRF